MSSLGIFNKETKTYQKVAGTAEAAVVDAEMSDTSINTVQNKVIKKYVDDGVEKLKKSVSDGKTKVANAITDKGVETATDATFDVMAENISKIETGGGELHGATISVTTTESTFIGKIIKLSLNSTTVATKTFDSNGACSFTDIQEAGTYSLYSTDGADSATIPVDITAENVINKTVISCEFYLTPDGETITPVDDVVILLKCAEIKDKSYTTMDELLADEQAMGDITMSENAMKYLARSTGFADAVCANETFMTLLGASSYVDSTVLNSDLWYQKIYNSDYADLVIKFKIMTAIIDLSNSNPATCVTYADDAVGMTAGDSAWDEFFGHYPVLLKNGIEVGKLNPNNFNQFEDGTTADISSGNAGDVMIAFPRRGLTITTVDNKIYISMTDNPRKSSFKYNAHTRGSTAKNVFYLGAYKGYVASSKLRSLSGKTPTGSQTIGTFRTQAQANGTGYEQSGFYQLIFRQCMYILKYKNLNSQATVGYGYVLTSHSAAIATGGTEAWGMDCELIKATNPSYMTDKKHHVKCFGLEDFWGNIWEWIDGIVTDRSHNMLTATDNFNDAGTGYTNQGKGASANIGNWMSKPQGTTETGFLAKEVNGSETTYFCDYTYLNSGCVGIFGGHWNDGYAAGSFYLFVSDAASRSVKSITARLMYL